MNHSKKRTYDSWVRFLVWLERERPRLIAPREIIHELLKTNDLSVHVPSLLRELWPEKEGPPSLANRRRQDSYRQALVSLRRALDQYNRLGLGGPAFLRAETSRESISLAAGIRQGPFPELNPHVLASGELLLARFVAGGIGTRERAHELIAFLTEELPPLCPAALAPEGMPDWRSDRLMRRGMAEDVLCVITQAMDHLRKNSPEMKQARAIRAQARDSVGLHVLNGGLTAERLRNPPHGDLAAFRLWRSGVRATMSLARHLDDVAPLLMEARARLLGRGRLDEARLLDSWLMHREISEYYESGNICRVRAVAERLQDHAVNISQEDFRPGALGLFHAYKIARMHVDSDPAAVAMDIRAMELTCLGAGHLFLATRLESYRVHLLMRIGEMEAARPISRMNITTRILIRDRSGLQFAIPDLVSMEEQDGLEGRNTAAALRTLAARLAALTQDYAARRAKPRARSFRHQQVQTCTEEAKDALLRALPRISATDLEQLCSPPVA